MILAVYEPGSSEHLDHCREVIAETFWGTKSYRASTGILKTYDWLVRKRRGTDVAPVRQVYMHLQETPQAVRWQSAGPSFRKHSMIKVVC